MRCYKCNSVLSETNFCNSCGTDVTLYKKIVRMSNTYYNMGLAKARVRDLSGAADLLRRSVRIDKRNVNARNLLGLVYFEMGECVAAFAEWVISKNIKSEKNVADVYLKAAKKLGVSPEKCLVFEDIIPGIQAGKAAGMCVCAIEDVYSHHMKDKKEALADFFITDYTELL